MSSCTALYPERSRPQFGEAKGAQGVCPFHLADMEASEMQMENGLSLWGQLGCSADDGHKRDPGAEPRAREASSPALGFCQDAGPRWPHGLEAGYLSVSVCVRLFVTPGTVARQAPLSKGYFQGRILGWVAISSSRGSSLPRNQICSPVSPTLPADALPAEPSGKASCLSGSLSSCSCMEILGPSGQHLRARSAHICVLNPCSG